MSDYHEPVMGSEILELFAPEGSGFYLTVPWAEADIRDYCSMRAPNPV
jgi:hypothetical protein